MDPQDKDQVSIMAQWICPGGYTLHWTGSSKRIPQGDGESGILLLATFELNNSGGLLPVNAGWTDSGGVFILSDSADCTGIELEPKPVQPSRHAWSWIAWMEWCMMGTVFGWCECTLDSFQMEGGMIRSEHATCCLVTRWSLAAAVCTSGLRWSCSLMGARSTDR